jgi:peptide deformylase
MSSLKQQYPLIIGENQPILRAISDPVSSVDKELKQFAHILLTLMHVYRGVWLSAPQIWFNIRAIAVTSRKKNNHKNKQWNCIHEYVMFNPQITSHTDAVVIDTEWCLSLPGIQGDVARYTQITVSYIDINNQSCSLILKWMDARIVQHEIDHLDGVLYIDKLVWPLKKRK